MTVCTNGTASDVNRSLTGIVIRTIRDSCVRIFAGVSISTYRAVGTTTIDTMEHITASDCYIRVTLDETESHIIIMTKSTAIDVAVNST